MNYCFLRLYHTSSLSLGRSLSQSLFLGAINLDKLNLHMQICICIAQCIDMITQLNSYARCARFFIR